MFQLEVAQASSRVSKVTLSCPEEKSTFHERLDGTFFWAMIDKIMVLQLVVPDFDWPDFYCFSFLEWFPLHLQNIDESIIVIRNNKNKVFHFLGFANQRKTATFKGFTW